MLFLQPGKDNSRNQSSQSQTISAANQHYKIKDVLKLAYQIRFDYITNIFIENINQLHNREVHYYYNILVYFHFKTLVFDLVKDIVYYEIKQIIARIKIKLVADNIIPKTI